MPKVLVTGGTGFIGNYVVNELLGRNVEVLVTSLNRKKAEGFSWFSKVKYTSFDFSSYSNQNYYKYFQEPDILIHLAWEGLPNYRSKFHIVENLPKHKLFLENMISNGLKSLTVAGTCLEYGLKEGCLEESMTANPQVEYAIAKDELRKYLDQLATSYHFKLKWMRLFYIYGKGQHPDSLIPQLEKAIARGDASFNMSGGQQERDFLPVELAARYIMLTALQDEISGIINCCSGKPIRVIEFVKDYLLKAKKEIRLNTGYYPYNDYEPMSFWGSKEKLKGIIK